MFRQTVNPHTRMKIESKRWPKARSSFGVGVKDDKYFSWTSHSRAKMAFYHLSPDRVKRVLKNPFRKEEGIAPGTLACMQRAGSAKHPYEIWVMYAIRRQKTEDRRQRKDNGSQTTIISAWRYPGITKPGNPIPIPDDILKEIQDS